MIAAAVVAALALAAAEPAASVSERDIDVSEGYRVYGLPTAEVLAADGYTGIRVFFTNAWGRHQPAVAVLRKGEAAPQVFAWVKGQQIGVREMTGDIRGWDWRVVRLTMDEARAAPVEQPKKGFEWPSPSAPGEEADGEYEYICMDSTTAAIEVIADGRVTRRERKSCPQDLTFGGAEDLLDMAAWFIDGCSILELQSVNSAVTRLLDCGTLVGEHRGISAQIYNDIYRVRFHLTGNESRIGELLTPTSRLTLPDGSVLTGSAITDWYVAESDRRKGLGFEPDTISNDGDTGRVTGGLFYEGESSAFYFWAPSEQTWRRETDESPWRMVTWTLGPWRREAWKD